MTLKKPDANKPVWDIFPEKLGLVTKCKCTICEEEINESDFEDELSKKEYSISGICSKCQKKMFKE